MLDKILNRAGIAIALLFMICELAYINAKSLLFIVAENSPVDRVFAILGSIAFSMVTVLVMRKSTSTWLKVAFPIFDALLVFCGFNLIWYGNIVSGQDNLVRFALTVFMAVFTGLITYSLGLINYKEHETAANLQQAPSELHQLAADLQQANTELQQKENKLHQLAADLQQKTSSLQQATMKLQQLELLQQQITAACTCEYCNKVFPSEAAKRSHAGKCPSKK